MHQDILRPVVGAAAIAVIATAGLIAVRQTAPAAAVAAGQTNMAVRCEPNQRALVHQPPAGTAGQVVVECVTDADLNEAAYVPTMRTLEPGRGPVQYMPAAYAPAAPQARPVVYAPATVTAPAPRPTATARQEGRSWKTRALVIGGAAGTGAGVGAIAGGKKGALIGAAIGGGGAALFEALKKK
jgi:hypothetical protein